LIRPVRFTALVAAAAIAASGSLAYAQAPTQGAGPQQPDLPALLHLRPDQMGAFHAFEQASQPRPDEIQRLRGAAPQALASVSTPQRLERIDAFLNTQLQMFHRSADATRAFYGQLSPDQQHSFDQLTAQRPGGRQGRPGG
jgi:periplasmic protein CpxP/Spy